MSDCENVKNGEKLEELVKKIEEEFWVPVEMLKQLADDMELMMRKGLEDEDSSCIKMLVSYVDSLPSGYLFLSLVCFTSVKYLVLITDLQYT